MRIENMQYVLEVINAGSISTAAKNLWMGQTTLSSIVRSVEDELHFTLFVRTSKGVKLTPRGEEAAEILKLIVNNYEELFSLGNAPLAKESICNIGCYPYLCSRLSSELINIKNEHRDHISLNIMSVPSKKIVSSVANSDSIMGIGALTPPEFEAEKHFAESKKINFETLYEDTLTLFVNKNSKYAGARSLDISEISNLDMVGTPFFPRFTSYYPVPDWRRLRLYSVLSDMESVKHAVASCDVAAIMPNLALENEYIKEGLIFPVALRGFDSSLMNFVVYPEEAEMSSFELRMLQKIRNFYASHNR